MATSPPPYANISGISRADMKDSRQQSFAQYDGNARPGELVVDLTSYNLYVGNADGYLNSVGGGGSATWATLGNKNNASGPTSIALGMDAGTAQGVGAIAFGLNAGKTAQSATAIAIGVNAGELTQGANAIAIGSYAGGSNQGANAIAIGNSAGNISQAAGSIVLNATGLNMNPAVAGFFVKPVRLDNTNTDNAVYYNTSTGEFTRSSIHRSGTMAIIYSTLGTSRSATVDATSGSLANINVGAAFTDAYIGVMGAPVDGQSITIRLTTVNSVTLSWDPAFRELGTALPTLSSANKLIFVQAMYDSAAAVWDVYTVSVQP